MPTPNNAQLATFIMSQLDRWGTTMREQHACPVALLGVRLRPPYEHAIVTYADTLPRKLARLLREMAERLEQEAERD